ncbi:MAG TPA: DUF6328 family protein [Pseudonocardia sp.]|nr:DUF6328 family protein [Pseudonocardia sp.]
MTALDERATRAEFDDDWNTTHRDEAPLQRADRNFAELLQELRVAQVGVQILFGFLLTLPFTTRFADVTAFERNLYIVTLALSALTAALLVAPVAVHRMLFQRGRKRELVRMGHRLVMGGLTALAATILAGLVLVLHVVAGPGAAFAIAGGLAVVFVALWLALPLRMRRG